VTAGAKGGGGKEKTPPGVNPFASSDLMALRSQLPSKPELASSTAKPAVGRVVGLLHASLPGAGPGVESRFVTSTWTTRVVVARSVFRLST
jgi:hypothetical protein